MQLAPKPITVEYVDPASFNGKYAPKPYVIVGNAPGAYTLPAATPTTLGGVKKAAAPATQDFTGLYAALQAAGVIS